MTLSLVLAILVAFAAALPLGDGDANLTGFRHSDIIERDVAIVGCGSSGTHAAISLKDKGYTSIVVEKKGRIGGHTETYLDPASGTPIDYGVVIFHNDELVKSYFSRFNITLTQDIAILNQSTFDLRTGKSVADNYYSPSQTAAALQKYGKLISQWPDLDNGMFLPEPVPEDLTVSLGAFAKRHSIEAIIPTFSEMNPGLGDLLSVPMVENLRVAGLSLMRSLATGFVTTENHVNQELYQKAQVELLTDRSLLLNSEVVLAKRSAEDGVKLLVMTPAGKKLVVAKRLLVTVPPKIDVLEKFDLTHHEKAVFSKFVNAEYYTGVVNNTGLPANLSVYNGHPLMPFNIAQLPGVYSIQETRASGFHTTYYGTQRSPATSFSNEATVKTAIIHAIKKLQAANPQTFEQTEPEFVAFSSHAPFYLQASAVDIMQGFYKDLYALQGVQSTYWTGAAWRAHDSSSIWRFNEQIVLPQLLEAIESK